MAAAAEKRLQQEESRGMKDPEGYKKKVEQLEKAEKDASQRNYAGEAPLKVNQNYLENSSNSHKNSSFVYFRDF